MNTQFTGQAKQTSALACARAPEFLERTCRGSASHSSPMSLAAVLDMGLWTATATVPKPLLVACATGEKTFASGSGQFHQISKMKKILKSYKHLTALLAVIILAVSLFNLGVPFGDCVAIVACWQLLQFATSRRRGYCYIGTLTPEQLDEFEKILRRAGKFVDENGPLLSELRGLANGIGGIAGISDLPARMDALQGQMKKLTRSGLFGQEQRVRWIGDVPFVSDDCATAITSAFVVDCARTKGALETLLPEDAKRSRILALAYSNLGIQQRAGGAMTTTDVPLPTIYVGQVIELVFAYGQARKYGTVFPLGAGTVKLPRLKTGEDKFAFLGAGTAGISQSIGEKEVSAELVTFTANKCGGLIRLPTELEEDTFVAIGQFLARFVARQFALLEDETMFLADGTSTYASVIGISKYCQTNTAYLQVLPSTKTATADATLADFRNMRALVNPAVLANMAANGAQTQGAYYLHPSFEPLLRSFNQYPNFVVFTNENGKPMFDGWPIRWIGVSAANSATASVSTPFAFFGDLSYWYLGERGAPRVEVSKEVFFATDELAMRALERIDVEAMAVDAMATLQTAAS